MKLLHLDNDFVLPEIQTLAITPKVLVPATPNYLQEVPRRKTILAILILLVFAGFSLTIPLHPSRSAVPNGCSTAVALPDGESAASCIYQATNPIRVTRSAASLSDTPANYLINSQAVSVQLAKIIFVKAVGDGLISGHTVSLREL